MNKKRVQKRCCIERPKDTSTFTKDNRELLPTVAKWPHRWHWDSATPKQWSQQRESNRPNKLVSKPLPPLRTKARFHKAKLSTESLTRDCGSTKKEKTPTKERQPSPSLRGLGKTMPENRTTKTRAEPQQWQAATPKQQWKEDHQSLNWWSRKERANPRSQGWDPLQPNKPTNSSNKNQRQAMRPVDPPDLRRERSNHVAVPRFSSRSTKGKINRTHRTLKTDHWLNSHHSRLALTPKRRKGPRIYTIPSWRRRRRTSHAQSQRHIEEKRWKARQWQRGKEEG